MNCSMLICHKGSLAENHVSIVTPGKWAPIKIYWKIPETSKVSQHRWKKYLHHHQFKRNLDGIKWERNISNFWWSHARLHCSTGMKFWWVEATKPFFFFWKCQQVSSFKFSFKLSWKLKFWWGPHIATKPFPASYNHQNLDSPLKAVDFKLWKCNI